MENLKPLSGTRVVDFSRILAGPFLTQILADMGAEVIKIESPGPADNERTWVPFKNGEATYFMEINRGKRSIELNLKNSEAIEICKKFIKESDIVIENYSPGVMKKFGLDYESLKEIKPDIIMCSISSFGQYGPLSNKVGYDMLGQAMGGLMAITGYPDAPLRVGASLGDIIAALWASNGVLGALNYRNITGRGQYIDVALVDGIFATLENAISSWTICGVERPRSANRHYSGGPYDVYNAKDGYVALVASNFKLFKNLCGAMGKPEMANDPKFSTTPARFENQDEMTQIINDWMGQHTAEEAIKILDEARVAVSKVFSIPEICASPHIAAREMLIEFDHPVAGKIKVPGFPIKYSETPGAAILPPPTKGQHTAEILKDFGFSDNDIERFALDKVTTN